MSKIAGLIAAVDAVVDARNNGNGLVHADAIDRLTDAVYAALNTLNTTRDMWLENAALLVECAAGHDISVDEHAANIRSLKRTRIMTVPTASPLAKTPASRQLVNLSKAMWSDAEQEIRGLQASMREAVSYLDKGQPTHAAQILTDALTDDAPSVKMAGGVLAALAAAEARARQAEEEAATRKDIEAATTLLSMRESASLRAANARLEQALRVAADAELYDPATGIIDADILEIVQRTAREALAAPTERQPARPQSEDGDG